MAKGGKYLRKKAPGKKSGKVVIIVLLVLIVLILAVIGGLFWYLDKFVAGSITNAGDVTVPVMTMSEDEELAMLGTLPTETVPDAPAETTAPVETSPEDTWPVIESDENITNIMLVGQAARWGETYRLSDSMILCSINRETKTLTMTSFLRDLRVVVPAYAGKSQGFNRMNVCYHLGSYYTGEVKGSMEMLALAVEQNFGVHVDHTVEVDFEIFETVVDLLGGVEVELTQPEVDYINEIIDKNNEDPVEPYLPGKNTLNGELALIYARLRKIDNDFNRTNRQRNVITSLLKKMMSMNIMDVHNLFMEVLPSIITDMTNEEITNYALEFIPMLKDIKIVSQSIPVEGTYWYKNIGSEEVPDYIIDADLKKNGDLLRESIGLVEAEATN